MAAEQLNGVIQHLRRAMLRDGAGRTDGQLVKDYLGGRDEAALAAVVLRHGPMVWGICRRILSNYHDAEDAFQATFLVLVRRAASIASPELVANWLYGVAHQTALKARATVHKRKAREKQVADMPETAVVDPSLWHDLQPLLDQELSRLPEIARVVLVLCDLQGKTRKEAAEHLGLPEGTVASRLARARVMLAKRLAQRGVALSAGALAAVLLQNVASAGVPDAVMVSAIRAASLFAAGQTTAAGAASLKVAALAEGVLKAMMINKLKAVVAVLLVLGFVVTGTTILTRRAATAQSATPAPRIAAAQDTKSILEGSKAGDRKELVPGIAFRWCPPGKFKMGEGDDTVDVELSKGFWLGETEVTQGQWKKLMGTSPWSGRTGVGARASTDTTPPKEGPDYAASYISYDDALAFCKKLTTQEQGAGRLPKGWNYSLPTEAQWEYACRAGTKTRFSFGDDASQLSQYAWFGDHSGKEPYARQVGLKKANAWGLCDMHGNVWEWCNDWYASKRSGGKDPVGPTTPPSPGGPPDPVGPITPPPPDTTSGRNRVVRGGSYLDVALTCISVNRFYYNPRLGNSVQGFRLAAFPAGQDDKKPMAEEPVERAAKQEKESFTAWGKEIGGLQAGLGYRPGEKRAYRHGETVTLVIRVRNVGKETVKFSYLMPYIEHAPIVTDGEGKQVRQPTRLYEIGARLPGQMELLPGKEIEIHELKRELRPASESSSNQSRPDGRLHALYGTGKVRVQYEQVLGDPAMGHPGWKLDPVLSALVTGKLELDVKTAGKKKQQEREKEGVTVADKELGISDWGPEVAGLRCRTTAITEIEQGAPLDIAVEMQSVPKGLKPNVRQLDAFLVAEFMELTLTSVKTGKSLCVRPYDPTSGMPAGDTGKYGIPLDGTTNKPWPISFPLVKLGAELEAGAHECTVRFSFPQKRSTFWQGTDAAWDSAGFWHGTVESGAFRIDILKEQPKTKTFLLPKRLRLEKGLKINYTKEDAEVVELKLRNGHFVSARYLHYNDKKPTGMTMTGVPRPGDVNPIISISDYKGGDRNVSITIEVFETVDPPVHLWNPGPESGGYKVLWNRTFDLSLTEKEIRQKQ